METQNLITKREAAVRAGVILRTIDNWLRTEKLTKHTNGLGQVRIDQDELDGLLRFEPVAAVPSSDR